MNPSGYQLVRVAGGAWSVHSHEHDETFHPVVGPQAEAEALYVRQLGLVERLARHDGPFVVWDVGLGAAANVLTLLAATASLSTPVQVVSFDRTIEPLEFALKHRDELGYFGARAAEAEALIRNGGVSFSNGRQPVEWSLELADFPALLRDPRAARLPKPHAILFDAFSPATNPAMWTLPLFRDLFRLLDPARPCAMPTYSRSTMLRVTLLLAGFCVGAGHATGEKEETTLAANDPRLLAEPLDARWLKRVRNSTSAEPLLDAVYRQAPLSPGSWEELCRHPQFAAR